MLDRHITTLAGWLSRPIGFFATTLTIAVGVGLGVALSFSDHWSLLFNLFLSIAALMTGWSALRSGRLRR